MGNIAFINANKSNRISGGSESDAPYPLLYLAAHGRPGPTCSLMNTIEVNCFNCIHKIASWTGFFFLLVLHASAEKVRAVPCRLCRS